MMTNLLETLKDRHRFIFRRFIQQAAKIFEAARGSSSHIRRHCAGWPKGQFFGPIRHASQRTQFLACKIFALDRTKMFHVKHFGTIFHTSRT